jgi:hypothetical protein
MATLEDYRYVLLASVERLRAEAAQIVAADAYDEGRQIAYFEALQSILSNAETVGMAAAEVGMADFNPGESIGLRTQPA